MVLKRLKKLEDCLIPQKSLNKKEDFVPWIVCASSISSSDADHFILNDQNLCFYYNDNVLIHDIGYWVVSFRYKCALSILLRIDLAGSECIISSILWFSGFTRVCLNDGFIVVIGIYLLIVFWEEHFWIFNYSFDGWGKFDLSFRLLSINFGAKQRLTN